MRRLSFLLLLLLCSSPDATAMPENHCWAGLPEVVTDLPDYAPGATARIRGSGFQPGETVRLQVLHTDGTPNTGQGHEDWQVVTDTDGGFETTWFVAPDDSAGSAFQLTAIGLGSGLVAQTSFTDNPHDGEGNMTVSPNIVTAGSAGNSFTFAFRTTSKNWQPNSGVTLMVPVGWTVPQTTNASGAGYVRAVAVGSGAVVNSTSVSGTGPWTITVIFQTGTSTGVGFDLTYGGGGAAVTAPVVAGAVTFAAASRGGGPGPLAPLASGSPVITVNTLPVPASPTVQRWPLGGVKVRAAALLGSDPDGDSLSLVSVGPASAQGGRVSTNGGWVCYQPANGFTNTDSFPYSISDTHNGTSSGTVTVNITANAVPSQNYTLQVLGNGSARVYFSGIPGRTYAIQFTDSLQPANWQPLTTLTASASGEFACTDAPPGDPNARFYRTIHINP